MTPTGEALRVIVLAHPILKKIKGIKFREIVMNSIKRKIINDVNAGIAKVQHVLESRETIKKLSCTQNSQE